MEKAQTETPTSLGPLFHRGVRIGNQLALDRYRRALTKTLLDEGASQGDVNRFIKLTENNLKGFAADA